MSKVFICYAHKDKKYFDLVNKHISINKKDIDIWSDKKIKGGDNWREEIQKALDSCNLAVLILSVNFFNSDFIQEVELEQLLENEFEKGTNLLPVLLEDCDIEAFSWIETTQILPSRDEPLENFKNKPLKTKLKEISQRVRELLSPIPDESTTKEDVKSKNYPDSIAINNFPESNDDFFGREKYLDILDKAWDDEQVNILSFIAFGGIGKTSLIDNWLKMVKKDHYRGAKNIFMWSFYSQGSEEDRQVTATEFLLEACKFFKIKKIPKTAYEQGRELADIVSKQRALLVLDGLEPLQSSLEDIGEIKDTGLQVLLKRLSRQNKGLVVISSRIKLASIDNQYEELEQLEDSEGADLLKSFDLKGTINELEKISKNFDGHALALKLLGSYTKVVLAGDITRIDEIESLRDDKSKTSKHATRMLNSYKKYLQKEGKVELDILKLLGFFDRAISFEVINVLKNKPLIKNINDSLVEVSEIDWKYALDNLKKLNLIGISDKFLDTHPLVREYFSNYIEENFEESYIEGHHRLYKYYENLPDKEYPDTIEEMEPLFQAIYHGSKAKKFRKIYTIYFSRINRNKLAYLGNILHRYDLGYKTLLNFFTKPYEFVDLDFEDIEKSNILSHIGYSLFTMGKSAKAIYLLKNVLNFNLDFKKHEYIISATILNLNNINTFYGDFAVIGNLEQKLAESSSMKIPILTMVANKSYLRGDFAKVEELYSKCKESSSYLNHDNHHTTMLKFVDFLLRNKNIGEVEKLVEYSFLVCKQMNWLTDIGITYGVLARVKFLKKEPEKKVISLFNKSIDFLRRSNEICYILKGLIYRAEVLRYYQKYEESYQDLIESYDLITYLDLKLLLADWYIVAIKLVLDEKDQEKARTYFLDAKELSKELNEYFIFKEELKKLEPNFTKDI